MEKSTILGLILGFGAVCVGMVLKGASLISLINNPAAYMIIIVGTIASVCIAFPVSELKRVPKLFKIILTGKKFTPKTEIINMFTEWATISRREGLLALESRLDEIEDPFLRNGMRMIIDGNDQDFVHDVLMEELHSTAERHKSGALIFTQAGTYAPTLGVLGAVVGLIAALGNLSDIEQLGQSISAAFVATLLGIFTGYVLWHPMANKLKRYSQQEIELKTMMVEGLLSIQSGVSTIAIQQKLSVYLNAEEREAEQQKGEVVGEQKAAQA